MSRRERKPGVGSDEGQVAIEAVRDQHAIERVAVVPVERARRLRIRAVDREFEEAGGQRSGARRSLEHKLARFSA